MSDLKKSAAVPIGKNQNVEEECSTNSTKAAYEMVHPSLRKKVSILDLDLKNITVLKMFLISWRKHWFSMITFVIFSFLFSLTILACVVSIWKMSSLIFANQMSSSVDSDVDMMMKIINALHDSDPSKTTCWNDISTGGLGGIEALGQYLKDNKSSVANALISGYFDNIKYVDDTVCCVYTLPIVSIDVSLVQLTYLLSAQLILLYLFAGLRGIWSTYISSHTEKDIKLILAAKIIYQDYDFYISYSTAELIDIYAQGAKNISEYLNMQQMVVLHLSLTIPLCFIVMMFIDSKMAFIVMGTTSLYIIATLISFKIAYTISKEREKLHKKDNLTFTERIMSSRLIKSSGTWEYEYQKLFMQTSKTRTKEYTFVFKDALQTPLLIGLIICLIFTPFIAGALVHNDDPQTLIESLSSFFTCSFVMISTLFPFQQTIVLQKKSKISAAKINGLIAKRIDIEKNAFKGVIYTDLSDSIVFENVSFAYPNRPNDLVFENVSLNINVGDKVGLIGESGCGKTTIIKLLLGFYKITSGKIYVDGVELSQYALNTWLESIAFIDQAPQLFSTSVFENVRYGMPDKTLEDVVEACKKAKIHDFIMSMPDKYDTILESGGDRLSGGQRQMMVFARLFLKQARVIIVDEATANLDPETEKNVMESFQELIENATVISISHKISLLKGFNRVVVMSPKIGIIQEGSYEDLEANMGYFNFLNSAEAE